MHPRLTLLSVVLALAFGFASPAAQAQTEGPAVTVSVANVRAQTGSLMAALYEGSFDSAPVARVRVPASSPTLTLRAPRPGRYAVRLFHDVNSDGELDVGFLGMPNEPYGVSNDAPARMGPPRYADAAFDVSADGATQTITLR